jgi:hypothetical protein
MLVLVMATLGLANAGAAEVADAPPVALRGFGTLGVACYSADDHDFLREERPDGPGDSRRCDGKLDSLLGLQLDANISDNLEGTLQFVSYHRADDSFTPDLTQANLRWQINEAFALRAGRIQSPMFLVSSYRNLQHVQPWVRPPIEIYNLIAAYSIDGLELSHRQSLGDWNLSLLGGLGKTRLDASNDNRPSDPDEIKAKFGFLSAQLERGPWRRKGGLTSGRVSYSSPELDAALSFLENGLGAPQLAADLAMDNKRMLLLGFGASYETDDWLVQSEYLYRTIDAVQRDQHGAYLLAGRRFGDWMPYAILAGRWSQSQGIEDQAVTPQQYAFAKMLVDGTKYDRTSLALGISRRLGEQATLKLQVDWIDPYNHSVEQLTTLNLDFVF